MNENEEMRKMKEFWFEFNNERNQTMSSMLGVFCLTKMQ